MKRIFFALIYLAMTATSAWATNPYDGTQQYTFGSFTGGTDNALDSVDTTALADGYTATVYNNGHTYNYVLDIDSEASEGSQTVPDPIEPDTGPGAWDLYHTSSAKEYTITTMHTSWADGLSDTEIWRTDLSAGEVLTPTRLEIMYKFGTTSSSDFNIDVYDDTTSTELWSTYTFGTGSPSSSGAGNQVILRITNDTGAAVEGCVNFSYEIQ